MSPPKKTSESGLARLVGSGTSGLFELLVFHPADTVAKRLMSNKQPQLLTHSVELVFAANIPTAQSWNTLGSIVFKDSHNASTVRKYMSLFPGLGFAAGYKIMQRIYKFGGQPFVTDYLAKNHKPTFNNLFGEKTGKTMMHAAAGSLVGVGEVVLLPLDILKIKRQTNPEAFRGRGLFTIVKDEGMGLYRGALWTAARNAPGSFALFGGAAVVKEHIFNLKDYSKATFFQNFCASIGGAVASITVAAPMDVVKTRIQNRSFDNPKSGTRIVKDMLRIEGPSAFFKGLTPKIIVVGPKLVFSFTVAQQLIPILHGIFETKGITKAKQL